MSSYAKYECLKVEVAEKVATVTLNRPQARNAINQKLIRELRTIWDDLADDHAVNAVVLTGAGEYFSVGGDVKAMSERPGGDVLEEGEVHDPMISRRSVTRQLELDKPIIAAINGDAIGLAATHALAERHYRNGRRRPHRRHACLARRPGRGRWRHGDLAAAHRHQQGQGISHSRHVAERQGSRADRAGQSRRAPRPRCWRRRAKLPWNSPTVPTWAIRWTKLSINQIVKERVNMLLEASMALEQVTFETADHKEATMSFKEKRKPKFGQAIAPAMDPQSAPERRNQGDAPRIPCAGFSSEHWNAARRQAGGRARRNFGDLDQARGAGRRLARVRLQRRRASRDSGGDGRTRPRRVPGADVVGRARQSRRFRARGADVASDLLEKLHAGTARVAFSLRRARSRPQCGFGPDRERTWRADCFASSRWRRAARIFSSPLSRDALAVIELGASGVDLEPTRAMGAWGLYEVRLDAAPATLIELERIRSRTISCSRQSLP